MAKKLYEHAQYELRKLGLHNDDDPRSKEILVKTLKLVDHFSKMEKDGMDEHVHKWVVEFFTAIANHRPLSPITDDPDEWDAYEDTQRNLKTNETEVTKRWQSNRSPNIISMDGGKTWVDIQTNKEGVSVDHVKQAEDWAKAREQREAMKKAEEQAKKAGSAPNVLAKPPTDTSTPAGEEAPAGADPKAPEATEPKADTPPESPAGEAKPKSPGKKSDK